MNMLLLRNAKSVNLLVFMNAPLDSAPVTAPLQFLPKFSLRESRPRFIELICDSKQICFEIWMPEIVKNIFLIS